MMKRIPPPLEPRPEVGIALCGGSRRERVRPTSHEIATDHPSQGALDRDGVPKVHFTVVEYRRILDYLEQPGKFVELYGPVRAPQVNGHGQIITKGKAFNCFAEHLNNIRVEKGERGPRLTGPILKERLRSFRRKYLCIHKKACEVGFEVTENDRQKGIRTIGEKLESMCPCYSRMLALFGEQRYSNPMDSSDSNMNVKVTTIPYISQLSNSNAAVESANNLNTHLSQRNFSNLGLERADNIEGNKPEPSCLTVGTSREPNSFEHQEESYSAQSASTERTIVVDNSPEQAIEDDLTDEVLVIPSSSEGLFRNRSVALPQSATTPTGPADRGGQSRVTNSIPSQVDSEPSFGNLDPTCAIYPFAGPVRPRKRTAPFDSTLVNDLRQKIRKNSMIETFFQISSEKLSWEQKKFALTIELEEKRKEKEEMRKKELIAEKRKLFDKLLGEGKSIENVTRAIAILYGI